MSRKITVPVKVGMKGRFRLIRRCAATGEVRQDTGWFDNLITNGGLDMLGKSTNGMPNPFVGCHVGSGNDTPTPGDSSLETFVAGTVTHQAVSRTDQVDNTPYYTSVFITYRFGEGAAEGNLSEVGIAYGTNVTVTSPASAGNVAAPLFSRALIVDSLGVPTTITVLGDEFLDVIWEFRLYAPGDISGAFDLAILGTVISHDYVIRPSYITDAQSWIFPRSSTNPSANGFSNIYANGSSAGGANNRNTSVSNGALGIVTNGISGSRLLMSVNGTRETYVPGNYYVDLNFRYGLNYGNVTGAGISAIQFYCNAASFQMSIDPPVEKTALRVFEITLRVSWGRH